MVIFRNACLAGVLALTAWTAWAKPPSPPAQKAGGCPPPVKFRSMSIHARDSVYAHLDGYTNEGFSMEGVTLRRVMEYVFSMQRIEGLPDWAQKQTYDVIAEIDPDDCCRWANESDEEESLTVQKFLQDKLKLKWHKETRMIGGFDLVAGKKGPKFAAAAPDAKPPIPLSDQSLGNPWDENGLNWKAISMQEFAKYLSTEVKHPVVDTTGLAGRYQLSGRYQRWGYTGGSYDGLIEPDGTPVQPPSGPTVFGYVEALGLELKGTKVPIDFLVIDQIEQPGD
jgi:uncharacterized protein (TIGR03435 family)